MPVSEAEAAAEAAARRQVADFQRRARGMTFDRATEAMSDETARLLAAQLQESWAGRWQVMWEPWGRKFRAFPAYDMDVTTPAEGATLRELWRAVLDVDQALLFAMAEAIPAHPPTVVYAPPDFVQEVLGRLSPGSRARRV
ncbi:hypothetical protein HTZ77_05340 [Nonomuraea sp. SMC257]|uniref:Uncharacterized protein n=1 Tax=Nonomuraea montanisoli TaxID=2741721 RepID=A0A7Y6M1A5_9ACTN|nr:hypothetical protein [Nonomuraea montanisoli]NUW30842.1 hypothetical protein [Nonomuraea montanisoli]